MSNNFIFTVMSKCTKFTIFHSYYKYLALCSKEHEHTYNRCQKVNFIRNPVSDISCLISLAFNFIKIKITPSI